MKWPLNACKHPMSFVSCVCSGELLTGKEVYLDFKIDALKHQVFKLTWCRFIVLSSFPAVYNTKAYRYGKHQFNYNPNCILTEQMTQKSTQWLKNSCLGKNKIYLFQSKYFSVMFAIKNHLSCFSLSSRAEYLNKIFQLLIWQKHQVFLSSIL